MADVKYALIPYDSKRGTGATTPQNVPIVRGLTNHSSPFPHSPEMRHRTGLIPIKVEIWPGNVELIQGIQTHVNAVNLAISAISTHHKPHSKQVT